MQFTQIRNATAVVTYAGKRFLIDPLLADRHALPGIPAAADPTLRNPTVALPCPVQTLLSADAALVTHLHFDHFDAEAARLLPKSMPLFAADESDAAELRGHGFSDVRTVPPEGTDWCGIRIVRTPALHGQGPWMADLYARLNVRYAACGYLLRAPGEPVFYLAGDTVWFEGVADTIGTFSPDVIALNACAARLLRGGPIIMGADDVWQVAMAAPDATLVATHMEAVSHATLTRATLRAFARDNGFSERLLIPADGETVSLSPPSAQPSARFPAAHEN